MFDISPPVFQRTRGAASVSLGAREGQTVLRGLRQAGSAKAFLPRVDAPEPEVVFLNTAGGLTGGDRLDYQLSLGAGTRATAATQTAERAYRASGGVAELTVRLEVGAGSELHWLPQETILFDGSALARETTVDLAQDARFLMVETVVLGRAAMGETVAQLDFTDRRIVRRAGVPVMIEPLRFETDTLQRNGPASLAAARAFSTVALFADDAEDALGPVRAVLDDAEVAAAASAWDGKLVVRAMASDGFPLRRLIARVLTVLRAAPLPRVWQV
ncbi:MAG: urease accessory protein UreD [Pseudomonadota bacterium]